jgi:hypothetical protein
MSDDPICRCGHHLSDHDDGDPSYCLKMLSEYEVCECCGFEELSDAK